MTFLKSAPGHRGLRLNELNQSVWQPFALSPASGGIEG